MRYVVDNDIINMSYVQELYKVDRKEKLLKKHKYSIWYNENEGYWYTYLPDKTAPKGRRKRKRRTLEKLEDFICDFYELQEQKKEELQNQENAIKELPCMEDTKESMTFKELFYEFMSHKKLDVSPNTIRRMMKDYERFYASKEEFIQKPFTKITRIDIDDVFNEIVDEHKIKNKCFYNMCGIVKQTFEYAVDAEYLEKSPYRNKVNKKKVGKSKKKPSAKEVYQSDEKDRFIAEMERRLSNNPSNTAPLAVMLDFELGTRKGEILAIAESDIESGMVHICKQVVEDFDVTDLDNIKGIGFKVVEYTKSEDGDRWLPLSEKAKELIARIKRINEENNESYKDFLFVRNGYIMTPDAIDTQIKRGCEYINMPVKTMHKIRKTYASTLFHGGVNISIVKDMLGHADETTTLRNYIYNTLDEEETRKVVLFALQGTKNVTTRDTNIVSFEKIKKAKNLA